MLFGRKANGRKKSRKLCRAPEEEKLESISSFLLALAMQVDRNGIYQIVQTGRTYPSLRKGTGTVYPK